MALSVWEIVLLATIAWISIPFVFYPEQTLHNIRKKRYQFEVTYGLFMMTPTEKSILYSILFITFSMITLASLLYLPSHIKTVSMRLVYYWSGHFHSPSFSFLSSLNARVSNSLNNTTTEQILEMSKRLAEGASDMAKGIVAVAAGQGGSNFHGAADPGTSSVAATPGVVPGDLRT